MPEIETLIENLTSGEDEAAEAAALQFGALGLAGLPALTALLASDQADTRWWSVRAISTIDSLEVNPILRDALGDPDPAVRQCAALGLTSHPCADFVPDLIACLGGKDQLLARLAGHALIAIGQESVPALIEVMETGPQLARLEAVKALAEIGDTRAIPTFYKAIQHGDSPLIEYWSEAGLEKLGVGMTFFNPDL